MPELVLLEVEPARTVVEDDVRAAAHADVRHDHQAALLALAGLEEHEVGLADGVVVEAVGRRGALAPFAALQSRGVGARGGTEAVDDAEVSLVRVAAPERPVGGRDRLQERLLIAGRARAGGDDGVGGRDLRGDGPVHFEQRRAADHAGEHLRGAEVGLSIAREGGEAGRCLLRAVDDGHIQHGPRPDHVVGPGADVAPGADLVHLGDAERQLVLPERGVDEQLQVGPKRHLGIRRLDHVVVIDGVVVVDERAVVVVRHVVVVDERAVVVIRRRVGAVVVVVAGRRRTAHEGKSNEDQQEVCAHGRSSVARAVRIRFPQETPWRSIRSTTNRSRWL